MLKQARLQNPTCTCRGLHIFLKVKFSKYTGKMQELENYSEDESISNAMQLEKDEWEALEGLQAFAQGEARSPEKRKREESSSSTNASSDDGGEDDDEEEEGSFDQVDLMINESSDDDGHRSENEATATPSHRRQREELPTIVPKKIDPPILAENELATGMIRVWGHGNRCNNVHAPWKAAWAIQRKVQTLVQQQLTKLLSY